MDIVDALGAREGVTCVVGAGGKKTTLYTLAERCERAIVTATVRIPIFDPHVTGVIVTSDPVTFLDTVEEATESEHWPLGLVPEREGEDRYRGYEPETVDDLAGAHDGPVLVKADGARTREFKAPGEHEPRIPTSADTVVPIASAHVVGEPLTDKAVHRPERVADLTDLDEGDTIDAEAVATVLASERGGLKDVGDATPIPMVNKVDDAELETTAHEIAEEIHRQADVPRVVLAQMNSDDPLVEAV